VSGKEKWGLSLIFALMLVGCEREQRQYQIPAAQSSSRAPEATRYEENAYAVAQGKTLFRWFNCNGCHSAGGGGMGPALMDAQWNYGSEPQAIYETIMNGRPKGMPAFRGRITDDQAWQLVAYVRSMSGWVAKDVAPGRADSLYPGEPENARDKRAR
jgi:cytochrome c oxidase cbb3-type subunit 3